MALHTEKLRCSVGDGASLSCPVLNDKIRKIKVRNIACILHKQPCNHLLRSKISPPTCTVMASLEPFTSILALFIDPRSISTGLSFSSSSTFVGFRSLIMRERKWISFHTEICINWSQIGSILPQKCLRASVKTNFSRNFQLSFAIPPWNFWRQGLCVKNVTSSCKLLHTVHSYSRWLPSSFSYTVKFVLFMFIGYSNSLNILWENCFGCYEL